MKTIVLTGGGSAGHVNPNMALLPELKKYFDKIVYIGTNGIEKQIVKQNHIEFYEIQTPKFERSISLKNFLIPFKLFQAIKQAKNILKQVNPDIIFTKGGFVSLPCAIAGKKLNIPIITHESDYSMGLANKIISKYAKVVCTTFEDTFQKSKKQKHTGNPIREEIANGKKLIAQKITGVNNNKKTIMFFGGSLGSEILNKLVYESIDWLLEDFNIIHITGKNRPSEIHRPNYYSCKYTNHIHHLFAMADIVVARAGANSIFELLYINKPMILVPLSKKNSRGDQIDNANYFKKHGFAFVIEEKELSSSKLKSTIQNLNIIHMKERMKSSPIINSNKMIVDIILKNMKSKK